MSTFIKNEAGEDVEVFSAEELAAQKEAAIEEYKSQNPDKSDELTKLQDELKIKEEELTKFKDKDLNFSNLRTQKEAAEKKIEKISKEIDEKIASATSKVLEGVMKDHYSDTLKTLASGDPELQKKIEFHYKRLGDAVATKEEMNTKLRDAWILATKPEGGSAFSPAAISSGGARPVNIQSDKKFTPEEKAFAQKLAQAGGLQLKDEDFK